MRNTHVMLDGLTGAILGQRIVQLSGREVCSFLGDFRSIEVHRFAQFFALRLLSLSKRLLAGFLSLSFFFPSATCDDSPFAVRVQIFGIPVFLPSSESSTTSLCLLPFDSTALSRGVVAG